MEELMTEPIRSMEESSFLKDLSQGDEISQIRYITDKGLAKVHGYLTCSKIIYHVNKGHSASTKFWVYDNHGEVIEKISPHQLTTYKKGKR